MTNKTLRGVIYGGIFAVLFVPFVVTDSMFFPFITGKNFAFRILAEIVFAAWLLLALRDDSFRPRRSFILWSLASFVGIMLIANIFGANFERSMWSNFERMEGWVTLLHFLGFTIVLASAMTREKLWLRFFRTSIGASIAMGIFGLFQLAGVLTINQGGVRVDGTFGNATYLAVYMLFHIFITLFLMLRHRESGGHKSWYFFYGSALLLQLVMLYNTATRGAILGLIGGILLSALLVAIFERGRPALRKWSIGALIVVVVLVGGFFAVRTTEIVKNSQVLSRFASISLTDRSTIARVKIWQMGWESFKAHPFLGTGQENFNLIFNQNYDPELYDQEQWFDRAHNVVIDWLTAGGMLGLLAYLSIFASGLWMLWRQSVLNMTERALLTGLLAAYFFHNLFVFDNVMSYVLFGTVLAFIHSQSRTTDVSLRASANQLFDSPAIQRTAPALIIAMLVWGLYFFNVPGIRASQTLIDALVAPASDQMYKLQLFKKALSYDTFGDPEIREQLVMVAQPVAFDESLPHDVRVAYVTTARDEMQQQIEETPDDARYRLFLGGMLVRVGSFDEGIASLEEAVRLSPDKQTLLFELGQAYFARGNTEQAVATYKYAYELEPQYIDAAERYALALLFTGQQDQAVAITNELIARAYDDDESTNYVPEDALINAYLSQGLTSKAVELFEVRVLHSPDNARYHLDLAKAYQQVGKQDAAAAHVEKALELDPSLREELGLSPAS